MKEFNLKDYLKNPSRKVVTRDGRNVRIVSTEGRQPNYPVLAYTRKSCVEDTTSHTKDGKYCIGLESSYDLFFAPEKHEGWVNLLKDLNGDAFVGSPIIYETKQKAEKDGKECNNYISTSKIEWEE